MSESDHKTTVVTTSSGDGAAWFLVGALVVGLAIGAYLLLGGNIPRSGKDIDVNLELPKSQ